MNEDMLIPFIPISLFAMIYFIVKAVADNKTRQRAIEKGVTEETLKNLFAQDPGEGTGALKWGMVAAAIGASLVVVDSLGISADRPTAFALPLLFAGGALVLYQIIRPRFIDKR